MKYCYIFLFVSGGFLWSQNDSVIPTKPKKLWVQHLQKGFIRFGFLDVDLQKVASFNNYEGFRLGVGLQTNDFFSEQHQLQGYTAVGTKDDDYKYQLGYFYKLDKKSNHRVGFTYTDDISEIANMSFLDEKNRFKIYDPRPINVSTFYKYVRWKALFETHFIPKTTLHLEISRTAVRPMFSYIFEQNNNLYNQYTITAASFLLHWKPFSSFTTANLGGEEITKGFPQFTLQLTKSIPKVLDNDFDFTKVVFNAEFKKKHSNNQNTNVFVEAAYAFGALPLTHAFTVAPNNITKEAILQRFTFSGKNSFETMFYNEFFATEFVKIQAKHALQPIKISKLTNPQVVFVSRWAWGDFKNPNAHLGINFKNLTKTYQESGVEINSLLSNLGIIAFYRHGANHLPKLDDNIAIKLSYVVQLD